MIFKVTFNPTYSMILRARVHITIFLDIVSTKAIYATIYKWGELKKGFAFEESQSVYGVP